MPKGRPKGSKNKANKPEPTKSIVEKIAPHVQKMYRN